MAEMVGGAVLSALFQSLFQTIDYKEIIDFFRGKKQIILLEKLRTALLTVNVVLDDAEMKQLRNPNVKLWLDGLKDAAEDAENLLDEISTDVSEAKILSDESGTTGRNGKLSCLDCFAISGFQGRKRKAKMMEILGKLEYFASQKDILGLKTVVGETLTPRLPSTSIEDSQVYGRNEDKDVVKKLVLLDNTQEVFVIPIVGMGGVGKTTLAQAIFNDKEVADWFEVNAWVCVSEEFDISKVTKTVLEVVTKSTCDVVDLDTLQVRLREKLKDKRFLVILDDVWSENYDNWVALQKPFLDGAIGSKIIVTTRIEKVASIMGTSPSYYLKELSDKDCWELFAKHASGNGDFMKDAKLEAIGRAIVKKCKGLPLAAKTLGGLLRSTLDVEEWERVLKSDIWDLTDKESNILPALRVSYHYLPSRLKICFAYCSMFPKDFEFQKERLILLWMAENLLCHSKGNKRMEDVGNEYFNDLVSRSFFQRMSNANRSWFVMHDLMVDLAIYVSGNNFQFGDADNSIESMKRLRHLAYYPKELDFYERFNLVLEVSRLRTFLPLPKYYIGNAISDRVIHDMLLKFKCLRSLSLCGYYFIKQLPDSIGELKHLRYLDLSWTSITCLPESACGLYNLQTLNLSNCDHLRSLPRYMHRLVNLRCLRLSEGCGEMPIQISKLKNLQALNIFIIGKDSESRICELRELPNIRGSICIKNLRNIEDSKDALEAKLKDKKYLRDLSLNWGTAYTNDMAHEKLVFENLVPCTSLEFLDIYNYGGTTFPNWVGDNLYGSIVKMELRNCKNCTSMPPLGQLASLKTLTISGFPAIVMVDHGFYGTSASSSAKHFPSLEELIFLNMSNWCEWLPTPLQDVVAFPKLKTLRIRDCQEFIANLPHSFPSLTELSVCDCQSINCSLPAMPILQTVELVGCENLLSQELPQTVQSLKIGKCGTNLVSLSEKIMAVGTCLRDLLIYDCSSLTTIGALPASLKSLEIENCTKIVLSFPHSHATLDKLSLTGSCDSIQAFSLSSFTNLSDLTITGLENLESLSLSNGASQNMASLSLLNISSCPNFESFPPGGLSAPKLTELRLENCEKWKSWPEQMHTLFPSLRNLDIIGCPEVESFPVHGFPINLRTIVIENCKKLIASRSNWNLTRLIKLEEFTIRDSSDIRCFPEEELLPSSTALLRIESLSSLETLNQTGLQQLTSLKHLVIYSCTKLRTIPIGGLPKSFQSLTISGCPFLEKNEDLKKQIRKSPNEIFFHTL